MKQFLSILVVLLVAAAAGGCASTTQMERDVAQIKYEIVTLKNRMAALEDTGSPMRKDLAAVNLRMDEMLSEVQQAQGAIDETTHAVQRDIQEIKQRLSVLESSASQPRSFDTLPEPHSSPAPVTPTRQQDAEEVYAQAYDIYKQGLFDEARRAFEKFLKQFPQTEYSDNAQFWIGEAYLKQEKYEQAILAYEEVVKNHPGGNKVPDALLKQGLCFKAMGDGDSARIILQRVIESYPGSSQAEAARRELEQRG